MEAVGVLNRVPNLGRLRWCREGDGASVEGGRRGVDGHDSKRTVITVGVDVVGDHVNGDALTFGDRWRDIGVCDWWHGHDDRIDRELHRCLVRAETPVTDAIDKRDRCGFVDLIGQRELDLRSRLGDRRLATSSHDVGHEDLIAVRVDVVHQHVEHDARPVGGEGPEFEVVAGDRWIVRARYR